MSDHGVVRQLTPRRVEWTHGISPTSSLGRRCLAPDFAGPLGFTRAGWPERDSGDEVTSRIRSDKGSLHQTTNTIISIGRLG